MFIVSYKLESHPVGELAGAKAERRLEVASQHLLVGALAYRLDDSLIY